MDAYQLSIEAKIKIMPFGIVSLDDFQYRAGNALDPRVVIEQPNISLYCLDHQNQRAIFVETPPTVDLLQAPFYFQAQYEAAHQLIAVPYGTLHALARAVQIDPARIILVYSTGRCGSTLISRVFDQATGVASFSEPDVFTQLVMLRAAGHSNDAEMSALLHDCLRVMCANTRHSGAQSWAFKFRSYVITLSELLYEAVAEAKVIFLYRNAETWAKSFTRAFGPGDDALASLVQQSHRWLVPLVGAYIATHTEPISYPEFLACMWLSSMQDCLKLQRQGASLFCARYEDLTAAPHEVITALFAHCGLSLPAPALLDHILAQDSQAGTVAAQAALQEAARRLTAHEIAELDRLIRTYNPTLAPDVIVPQTFRP
jgi:Sulfotransferase domain